MLDKNHTENSATKSLKKSQSIRYGLPKDFFSKGQKTVLSPHCPYSKKAKLSINTDKEREIRKKGNTKKEKKTKERENQRKREIQRRATLF